MSTPLTINFKDLEQSDAIEKRIRERADKLSRHHDRITECRVVVQAPHQRHHKGKLYHVRIDVDVPGGELFVNREGHEKHQHEDVYVAIRDAFDAMERQLEAFAARHRGHDGPQKKVAE